uniref:NADH-ubiquinone oxidoreductase chain 3 n=1 Tax=Dicyema japonicum TaxID=399803 RepID=A0A3G1SC09_DICJA|nr:NADH dehydrogenase subunit 3 [Dicyema japonicum]
MMLGVPMVLGAIVFIWPYRDVQGVGSFECGFDTKNSFPLPHSVHFFKVAVLFVIFDVEIMFLIPLTIVMHHLLSLIFIMFLLGGLLLEWYSGSVEWV